jgi:hypothetical protein
LGQKIYAVKPDEAHHISTFTDFNSIKEMLIKNGKILVLMGQGQHKIKTKAEQMACNQALQIMKNY